MSRNVAVPAGENAAIPLLKVMNICAGYGKRQVVNDVSFEVGRGEIVAIIGHNGAGKSTLLKALFGLIPIATGTVELAGEKVRGGSDDHDLRRKGVSFVPQGNRVFADLTVRDNLEVGGAILRDRAEIAPRINGVLQMFPDLDRRLRQSAGTLSGGEKQMLALATSLVAAPNLLLLDEPSLGLAPRSVANALQRIQQISRENGVSVLIVEQKVREVLNIADRVNVLRNGRLAFSGAADDLKDERKLRAVYL
jgi:branched-chain amino acid transport system ATP-binding protein